MHLLNHHQPQEPKPSEESHLKTQAHVDRKNKNKNERLRIT